MKRYSKMVPQRCELIRGVLAAIQVNVLPVAQASDELVALPNVPGTPQSTVLVSSEEYASLPHVTD